MSNGSLGIDQTLPGPTGPLTVAHTHAAFSSSSRSGVGVGFGEFVSVEAVGFGGVAAGGGVTSEDVGSCGDWLEVVGVDASFVSAEVVEGESFGDGSDEVLVDESVGASTSDIADPLDSVPVAVFAAEPFPAVRSLPHFGQ